MKGPRALLNDLLGRSVDSPACTLPVPFNHGVQLASSHSWHLCWDRGRPSRPTTLRFGTEEKRKKGEEHCILLLFSFRLKVLILILFYFNQEKRKICSH